MGRCRAHATKAQRTLSSRAAFLYCAVGLLDPLVAVFAKVGHVAPVKQADGAACALGRVCVPSSALNAGQGQAAPAWAGASGRRAARARAWG